MSRLKILILLLVVISGVRLALAAWDWLEAAPITPKQALAGVQPRERAYINISPKDRARLLVNIGKVKVGDSKEEVYEKLGKPPADLQSTTRPIGKDLDAMVVASQIIAYYIKQKHADRFDENFDEHIYIFLDQDDLVEYIYVLRQDEAKPVKYPKLPPYLQARDKKQEKK